MGTCDAMDLDRMDEEAFRRAKATKIANILRTNDCTAEDAWNIFLDPDGKVAIEHAALGGYRDGTPRTASEKTWKLVCKLMTNEEIKR